MRTVSSLPQNGPVVGAAIAPCSTYGVVVVTVQYGAGAGPYDVDVDLDIGHRRKVRNGPVFTFEVAEEEAFEVVLTSRRWSRRADYTGLVEPNKVTAVAAAVELHAIRITQKDTEHFVPYDEFVRLTYAITGEPETVGRVELVVFDRARAEVERQVVAGPYAAQGTCDWRGTQQRNLAESPFTLRLRLTSDVGTVAWSNTETVAIQVDRLKIALDDARVNGMAPGREKEVLKRLQSDFLRTADHGRLVLDSLLFKMDGNEMNDRTSFTEHAALWGAGIEVPLVAAVTFDKKDGSQARVPRLLDGAKILWDVLLMLDQEETALLQARHVHQEAGTFWTTVAGREADATRPQGRTAHKDLGGMRARATARSGNQDHWRRLENAWTFTRPVRRSWAAYTQCDATPVPGADSGIRFRAGRIAGDVHRVRAFLEAGGDDFDQADADLSTRAPRERMSSLVELENWRVVFISENYHVGDGMGLFDAAPLRAEYDKAAVLITRGNGFVGGDKTNEWRQEYHRLAGIIMGQAAWLGHAMLDQCGDHPAAFRSFSGYLSRAFPGLTNAPKRAMSLLSSSDEAEYARQCDRYSATVIKIILWNLFPSAATAGAAFAPPGGRPAAGPAGLTVIQFAGQGQYNRQAELNDGTITTGWAPFFDHYNRRDKACFLTFNGNATDAKTMVHEIGHHLFLAHAPGHFQQGVQPAGYQPNAHAANEWCLMSYHRDKRHFCGLCLMKLAGYDYVRLRPDATVV